MQRFEMVFQEKGQDHLIMKGRRMELLRRILIIKRHPKLRKVSEKFQFQIRHTYEDEMSIDYRGG